MNSKQEAPSQNQTLATPRQATQYGQYRQYEQQYGAAQTAQGYDRTKSVQEQKTSPQSPVPKYQSNTPYQQPQRRIFMRPVPKEAPTPMIASANVYNGRVPKLQEASISPAAKREATSSIPWNELSPQAKQRVQSILNDKTLYRRLSQQLVYCEPIMYDFLVEHPDVVVAMWEKLGVTQISLTETGRRSYVLKESVGSAGTVDVLYKTKDYCIAYSRGAYHGPVLPKAIDGETILILRSYFGKDENGESYVVSQVDAFVKIHNFGVDVFAKMFAPMLGKIADNNFEQTIAFIGNVSEAAQTNPEVIKRLALKLEPIRPEVREELIRTTYKTAQIAIDRADEENQLSPYARNLAQQQAKQYEQQKQQLEQDRAQYMRELHQRQMLLQANQKARERSKKSDDSNSDNSRVHVGEIPYLSQTTNGKYTNHFEAQLSPDEDLTVILSKLTSNDALTNSSTNLPEEEPKKRLPQTLRQNTQEKKSASELDLDLGIDLNFNFAQNNGAEGGSEDSQNTSKQSTSKSPQSLSLELDFDLPSPAQDSDTSEELTFPDEMSFQEDEDTNSTSATTSTTAVGKFALADRNTKKDTQTNSSADFTNSAAKRTAFDVPTHTPSSQKMLPIFAPVPMKSEIPTDSTSIKQGSQKESPSNKTTSSKTSGTIMPVASQQQFVKKQLSESSTNSSSDKKNGAVFKAPAFVSENP